MCSTPCGITDYLTPSLPAMHTRSSSCAQRLAASLIISPSQPQSRRDRQSGAQRLAASLIISRVWPGRVDRPDMCSTPCGITDYLTVTLVANAWAAAKCSTPCGITDYLTKREVKTKGFPFCAQRLAASLIISQGCAGDGRSGSIRCSTPCGITDYLTRAR